MVENVVYMSQFLHKTTLSVQIPYIAGHSLLEAKKELTS